MFSNLGLVGISLALTPKIINKEKIDEFELRKLYYFCSSEYANNKLLKENTQWEKISADYIFLEGPIIRIHKELIIQKEKYK